MAKGKTGDKVIDAIGLETKEEMDSLSIEDLKAKVVKASQAMKEEKEQLEANPKYQELKASMSACTQGKKDVDKRQKAIIAYALRLLDEKGQE